MKLDLSKIQTHVLELPMTGRVTLRVRFTEAGIISILALPCGIQSRREKRILMRWQSAVGRGISADPRPLHSIVIIAGRVVCRAVENAGKALVMKEGIL